MIKFYVPLYREKILSVKFFPEKYDFVDFYGRKKKKVPGYFQIKGNYQFGIVISTIFPRQMILEKSYLNYQSAFIGLHLNYQHVS
jgi:hypothetical protein